MMNRDENLSRNDKRRSEVEVEKRRRDVKDVENKFLTDHSKSGYYVSFAIR